MCKEDMAQAANSSEPELSCALCPYCGQESEETLEYGASDVMYKDPDAEAIEVWSMLCIRPYACEVVEAYVPWLGMLP